MALAPALLATPLAHHYPALVPAAWSCLGLFAAACLATFIDPLHRSPQDFISGTRHTCVPRTRRPEPAPASTHAPQSPGRERAK